MKFFTNRYYSTACKIIDSVEKNILNALKQHPKIIRACEKYDVLTFNMWLGDKPKLSEALGDVLKNDLPKAFYDNLNQKEQNKLCELILDNYLMAIKRFTENLNKIGIDITVGDDHRFGDNLRVRISLQTRFMKKDILSEELHRSISLVNYELIRREDDIFQFQNSML